MTALLRPVSLALVLALLGSHAAASDHSHRSHRSHSDHHGRRYGEHHGRHQRGYSYRGREHHGRRQRRVWVPGSRYRVWSPARYETRCNALGIDFRVQVSAGHYSFAYYPGRYELRAW